MRLLRSLVLARHRRRLAAIADVGTNFVVTRRTSIRNEGGRGQVTIGNYVSLLDTEIVCYSTGRVSIGDYSWVSLRGQIISTRSVVIGSCCIIARDVYISDTN